MIERRAVDADIGWINFRTESVRVFAANRYGARFDPRTRIATGAVTEVGEKLIEATHERRMAAKMRRRRKEEMRGDEARGTLRTGWKAENKKGATCRRALEFFRPSSQRDGSRLEADRVR